MPDETLDLKIKIKSEGGAEVKKTEQTFKSSFKGIRTDAQMTRVKLKQALDTLKIRPFREIDRDIKKAQAAFNRLKRSGVLSAKEIYKAEASLKEQIKELKNETNGWTNSIARAKAGFVAMAAVGYGAIKTFSEFGDFKQRMSEVNTLLDITKDRYAALSKEVMGLTKDIPQTAVELAAAQYDIISAGVALEKSVKTLELSAKAAVAGVTDTKTAVNLGIGVINAYGMSMSRLDEIYDILFQTVRSGVTTFPQLAQYMGDVLPSARAADVGIKVVSASIAAMTKAGIRTPQAVTALKGAINALSAPAAEAQKEFNQLGITWQGLIPTLKAIKEKQLDVAQMRKLIPDVEARTGVLALTQNFETLTNILGQMDESAGATEKAYNKMKDTPQNQIKLLANEIAALGFEFGGMMAKGLLPAARAIRILVSSFKEAGPEAKILALIMSGYASAFIMWKMGLASIILGLKGMILEAGLTTFSLKALKAEFIATSAVMKAGLIISIAFAGYEVLKAVKAMKDLRNVMKENREEAAKAKEDAKQYAGAKDIQIKSIEEFKKMSEKEQSSYKKSLVEAMKYYNALEREAIWLSNDAKLGGLLPFQSAKGKENERMAGKLSKKTLEYTRALQELTEPSEKLLNIQREQRQLTKELKDAEEKLTELEKERPKVLKDTISAIKEEIGATEARKQAIERTLRESIQLEAQYADEVARQAEAIAGIHETTQEKIRNIRRRGMSEEELEADRRKEYQEKLAEAAKLYMEGELDSADKVARKAQDIVEGFKDQNEAIQGVKKSGELLAKIHEEMKRKAEDNLETQKDATEELKEKTEDLTSQIEKYKKKLEDLNKQLKELTDKPKLTEIDADIKKAKGKIDEIKEKLDALKDKTITVTTIEKHVEAHSGGGSVGLARGGKLPGWGGGDRIRAMLEAGEFVLRKEAVRKYGIGLLSAINSLKFKMPAVPAPAFSLPNISLPEIPFLKDSVASDRASEAIYRRFEIKIGDAEIAGIAHQDIIDEFDRQMRRAKLRMKN